MVKARMVDALRAAIPLAFNTFPLVTLSVGSLTPVIPVNLLKRCNIPRLKLSVKLADLQLPDMIYMDMEQDDKRERNALYRYPHHYVAGIIKFRLKRLNRFGTVICDQTARNIQPKLKDERGDPFLVFKHDRRK
jgi:hypothetical protein